MMRSAIILAVIVGPVGCQGLLRTQGGPGCDANCAAADAPESKVDVQSCAETVVKAPPQKVVVEVPANRVTPAPAAAQAVVAPQAVGGAPQFAQPMMAYPQAQAMMPM